MSESKQNFKDYIIYFLALVVLVLGIKTCNLPSSNTGITHTSDTIIQTKVDTLVKVDTMTITKIKIYAPSHEEPMDGTLVNTYYDTLLNDTAEVYLKAKAQELYSTELKLKLKIPTITIIKDSIITINNTTTYHDTITKKVIGYSLNGGLHSRVGTTGVDLGPIVHFNTPIGSIGYGYGIISKSHQIFLTLPLIKPKR